MIKLFILLGDKIDYGGVVILVFELSDCEGKGIVCIGDWVICLKKGYGSVIIIVMGDVMVFIDGCLVVWYGDKMVCGVILIVSYLLIMD